MADEVVPNWLQKLLLIDSLLSEHFTPACDFTITAIQIQINRVGVQPAHFPHFQCDAHQRDKSASIGTRRGEDSTL